MVSGIQLTLLMGPIVPLPAPRVVLDALESVKVTTAAGTASGFQLNLRIDARSELHTIFLIAAGQTTSVGTPPLRVMLIVTMNGTPQRADRWRDDQRRGAGGQPGRPGTSR